MRELRIKKGIDTSAISLTFIYKGLKRLKPGSKVFLPGKLIEPITAQSDGENTRKITIRITTWATNDGYIILRTS